MQKSGLFNKTFCDSGFRQFFHLYGNQGSLNILVSLVTTAALEGNVFLKNRDLLHPRPEQFYTIHSSESRIKRIPNRGENDPREIPFNIL